jgi:hypothetical protein
LYLSLVVSRLEKLKRYKPPGTDQIPVEQIQAGDNVLRSEIHKLINSIWNKEQLPWQCNEFIIVPICKQGGNSDCSNYRGTSMLLTIYKILSKIFVPHLTP